MADRTRSSITVEAGKAEIMAVIADLEAYPEWANGIRGCTVQETGADGRASRAKVTFDGGPVSDTVGLAYTWEDDDRVTWELVEAGSVVTGLHGSYTLDVRGSSTEVVYELAVDVRIPLPGLVKRQAEKRIVGSALKGLKRHVES
ncbi:polyketide cyclase/dehydrase/lipid transport protein [Actinomadura pelletieri DSM 43383]|uniref:Polyketide cyclase/dehydrase/lipid transport protein n=1 Tax=Actinomadura pelletieri DSM 43383 TaxID=1120940 RepID=A0A495QP37_9ACTN|nr:SRPBCC family protein [Actinomadura pelletieri]RKS74632.1 polyketide cyclase/dehydrase/lipid transport protein [Actinomadura pelletieri DSM 43383]